MATKPTRQQDQACDRVARVLLDVTAAARLDGRSDFNAADLFDVARHSAKALSAFGLDEILARALEARGRDLGLRSGTSELLTLVDGVGDPMATLLLDDEGFRALVDRAEAELGEV